MNKQSFDRRQIFRAHLVRNNWLIDLQAERDLIESKVTLRKGTVSRVFLGGKGIRELGIFADKVFLLIIRGAEFTENVCGAAEFAYVCLP